MSDTTTSIPEFVGSAFEAFNAGDPEPMIALYADHDVLVIGTDASCLDEPSAIAAAFQSEAGHVHADWDLRAQPLGTDAQLLTGRIAFTLPDSSVLRTRATYVLRRDGGDWRIAHSHLSLAQA